ncbi:MAG: 4-hydroxy-2-oxo-heptane-1,7-dioate aldolase [Rhodobacteraceae bacterium]|nr:MAG: 4-hydroxy-2-oxo-heptane-1,7-dioate aldolase [Paracoccaceae bacterium]
MVRPGSLNPAEIKKLLDFGAQNILVPYVQTVEDAELAAASVAYPPHGIRGVSGMTRATCFGSIAGYHKAAREDIALIIQVETVEAVDQIEAMAKVDGVDAIFVGPADLAASLGYPGEPSHPEVQKACVDAIKRITATGMPAGFMSTDLSFVDKIIDAGAVFVSRDIDMVALKRGMAERL